jgi:hypothetical protein
MTSFDFEEHIRLQQQIILETVATKPDALTRYEIWTRGSDKTMQIQMSPPFELTDEAVEAIREMFIFSKKNGQSFTGMHLTFSETEGKNWKMSSDYEH